MRKSIVYCHCRGEWFDAERQHQLVSFLESVNVQVIELADLCGCVVLDKEKLDLFRGDEDYLIIGCHPRSMKLLLDKAGINVAQFRMQIINVIDMPAEQLFRQISAFCLNSAQSHSFQQIAVDATWPSWFPVIDYARCSACGQCADFCLFGVYDKESGITVVNPQACKNNCPACARICPQTAIVFPKYKHGGAISGSDAIDERTEQQRQQRDINTILGADIYNALEQRKAKRQSIIRNEAMRKAMTEREQAKDGRA